MVVPIGDTPNPRGVPVVTVALIALNVAVFVLVTVPLALEPAPADPLLDAYLRAIGEAGGAVDLAAVRARLSAYDLFVFQWGFRPSAASLPTMLTSMFLHAGGLHLAGNMLFLWIYGDNVEHRLGRVRYLAAYLATGLAAILVHWMAAPGSALPVVGASGAISGVLGFYFVWFPYNRVRLLWLLPPVPFQVIEVPARIVLGLYLVFDNVLPWLLGGGHGGVAHAAHIGGFVAGLAIAWATGGGPRPRRVPRVGRRVPVDWLERGRRAERAGDLRTAVAAYRRTIRDAPAGRDAAEAHARLGGIFAAIGQPAAAYQHLRLARQHEADPEVMRLVRAGLAAVDRVSGRRLPR